MSEKVNALNGVFLLICAALTANCSEKTRPTSTSSNVEDSSSVAPVANEIRVDSASTSPDSTRQDTILAKQITVIGETEGAPEYLFGRITAVALGPDGNVYVADRIGSFVRAFDLQGKFVGTIGREGGGPGEFSWPADLTFDRQGRLWVRDSRRITVFARRQSHILPDSPVHTIPTPKGNTSSWRARTVGKLYYYPDGRFRDPARFFYVVFDSSGPTGDTLHVPSLRNSEFFGPAFVRMGATDGLMIQGVSLAPFEPTASWDITRSGTVVSSPGDAYEFMEVRHNGDTIRRVALDIRQASLPPNEVRDSTEAFRRRLASIPVALDQVVGMSQAARAGKLPVSAPPIVSVHTADGQTWLRRWTSARTTVFDVIDDGGHRVHTVVIPALLRRDPRPFVSTQFVAGLVHDPNTDLDRVTVFRVTAR